MSMCTCVFHEKVDEVFVVVGTAKDLRLKPRRNAGGFVHVYRVENSQLVLVHKTQVDDVPTALCPFQGIILLISFFISFLSYFFFSPPLLFFFFVSFLHGKNHWYLLTIF